MGIIQIEKLNPHPKNDYYFTDISGEKYEEVKRSIKTYGIRDPLKVTTSYTIISGHQRYRIAKELEIKEVPVEIIDVDEWQAEYLLIAENTERRGEAESDPIRKGRIAGFLKEYWDIRLKSGRERLKGQNVHSKTLDDIAEYIGEDKKTTQRLIKLNSLIPQLQQLVSSGVLGTTAAEQLAYLTEDEQKALYEGLGSSVGDITVQESKQIRSEIERLRSENERLLSDKKGMEDTIQRLKSQEPKVVEKVVEKQVIPEHIHSELDKLKNDKEELRKKMLKLIEDKDNAEKEKEKIEKFLESEEREIERLKKEAEKRELEAHISISELQIGIHEFIQRYSPNVFLQGVVASGTTMLKQDIMDSVIALEDFTNTLRNIVNNKQSVRMDVSDYSIGDIVDI
ncbi:Nucleoid occlusion protein [compost metagenome]